MSLIQALKLICHQLGNQAGTILTAKSSGAIFVNKSNLLLVDNSISLARNIENEQETIGIESFRFSFINKRAIIK